MKIGKTKIQQTLCSPKARKYALRTLAAYVLIVILGFLALPPLVKYVAANKLSEALHRPVDIRRVSINPFKLSLTVEGFNVKEREGDGDFAGFESLYLDLQAASLFRWGPVINEIRLVDPRFHIVRLGENRYNFSDLADKSAVGPEKNETGEDKPPVFSLNNIKISGGSVEFDDRVAGKKHTVGNIALALPFVSNMDYATDILVEPHFSATVNGAPLDVSGKSKPFAQSHESEFLLKLDGMQLPMYFGYLPVKLPVKLESGVLDMALTLVFDQKPGKMPRLVVSGAASVADVKAVEAAGQALAAFRRLDVAVGSADVFGGRFVIDRVALDSPDIVARADQEGTINWLNLLPARADSDPPDGQAPKPVEWSLGEVKIAGGTLHWEDRSNVSRSNVSSSNAGVFLADIKEINALVKNLDGQGAVTDFELAWKVDGGDGLKVDAVTVKEGKLDLANRRVWVGDARLAGAQVLIKRLADGRIEWIQPPALRFSDTASTAAQENAPAPWVLEVAKLAGEAIGIRFEDAAVSPRTTQSIEGLSFELSNVSSEPGQAVNAKMAFKLNRRGAVAVDGKFGFLPLDAELNLDAKTIELVPLQPYFSEKLNINIKNGYINADGKIQLRGPARKDGQEGGDSESGILAGGFTGQAAIGGFQAVDKASSSDFLNWKSLRFENVDARIGKNGPESVSVGEIALADFFARVIVSPEGKLNLFNIVRRDGGNDGNPEASAAEPGTESADGVATVPVAAKSGAALPVKIGKISLQRGSVRFTDNFVKPNYSANLRQIGGSVTGLSSDSATQARLELRGSYDRVAPVNVSARINPLSAKPYLDLQADVKGIDLTTLSAYSGKYAGYAIDKGKLSLAVKYKIENDQLEAENRVFLDQLTFGEAVDSPDATTLPVRLAVSLLKNRNGEIDINLPISGSLNDPQFSVGGLVVKVLVNLLMKAATSPFALIGSIIGGGEELSDVDFDSGRAALTPEAVARLENLAKALAERPELKFEIEGLADPEQDTEGLKRANLDRKIRAQKREDRLAEESETAAVRMVEITEQEYPDLLERVYKAEGFDKPRNAIGFLRRLPVEEMEKLILANSAVTDDNLKSLADRRAKAVRDWLIAHGVEAERIFLLPGKVGAAEEGKSGRRAEFSLK